MGRAGLPIALGGGGGLVTLILFLALNLLGSGDALPVAPSHDGGATTESREQLAQRCNTAGAIERYDDCHVVKSYNEVNEVWASSLGRDYRQPGIVFFEQATSTGCGNASSSVGPFYCPADERMYFDLGFLNELQRRFGADGRYAQTYIVAHEVGHHLQHLQGTHERAAAARDRQAQQRLSIGIELQADCYAGAWSALANRAGNYSITEAELDQALNAAAAVGDDRIQERTQGRVDPEQWTHGSAEQRRSSFLTGYGAASLNACASLVPGE